MHCQISYIETVEKKKVFFQSFNSAKCMVVGFLMVEGLENFNRCFWMESVIT